MGIVVFEIKEIFPKLLLSLVASVHQQDAMCIYFSLHGLIKFQRRSVKPLTYIISLRLKVGASQIKTATEMLYSGRMRTQLPMLSEVFDNNWESREGDSKLKTSMVSIRNKGKAPHKARVGDFTLLWRENPSTVAIPIYLKPFRVKDTSLANGSAMSLRQQRSATLDSIMTLKVLLQVKKAVGEYTDP